MAPQRTQLILTLAAAVASLAGCTAPATVPEPEAAQTRPVVQTRETGRATEGRAARPAPPQNAATTALLAESRAASDAGDFDVAVVSLERALRIDPNDARLWIELAEAQWQLGNEEQAATLAQKAVTLAGDNSAIERRAARLQTR